MIENRRYSGFFFQEIKCKIGLRVKIPIFFFFKLEKLEEDQFVVKNVSPPEVLNLIKNKEFLFINDLNLKGEPFLVKALPLKFFSDDSLVV
ncbi:MAG: hypothetical protein ABGX27_07175 [Desulfurobacteriaceae bacterium]